MKRKLTLSIEEEVLQSATERIPNISKFVEDCLKEFLGYNAGNYESLVIKLGKAKGNNFWCVLFPPLCMVEEDKSLKGKVEYKSYVKELLDKYFK